MTLLIDRLVTFLGDLFLVIFETRKNDPNPHRSLQRGLHELSAPISDFERSKVRY